MKDSLVSVEKDGQSHLMMNKIFCVGFQKTGTTSLNRAMQLLGFNVCPSRDRIKAWRSVINGEYNDVLPDIIAKYDFFEDNPWYWPIIDKRQNLSMIGWLIQNYPDAKIILTTRKSTSAWYHSVHYHKSKRRGDGEGFNSPQTIFVYGENSENKKASSCDLYEQHNRNVRNIFSDKNSENFLELQIESDDKWIRLCQFLNVKQPAQLDFPHENRTTFWYKIKNMAARALRPSLIK